jgi:hypothetical protein
MSRSRDGRARAAVPFFFARRLEIGMRAGDRLARIGMAIVLIGAVASCISRTALAASAQAVPPPQSPPPGQTPTAAPPSASQPPAAPAQPPAAPAQPPAPAQQPAAPAKPPAAPPGGAQPAGLSFTAEAGLALFTVKAEGAADFEAFFAKVKDALEKSAKPEYKEIAAGWKIYKITDALQTGQVLYASIMDPATKGVDYDPVKILSEVSSADVTALYPKFKDALISVNRLNLQPLMVMKTGGL